MDGLPLTLAHSVELRGRCLAFVHQACVPIASGGFEVGSMIKSSIKGRLMKGIRYLTDGEGNQTAIVIDLAIWGELVDDLLDAALMRSRRHEPDIPWEEAERQLAELAGKEKRERGNVPRQHQALGS
ncbi:hypothetical protein FJZ36_09230 [Candidatus Poribacteria bacterium]|nr:hypothetical protein [Candidatus Poribacteria bacterium]